MGGGYAVKRVSLIAPVFTQSGYGVHARQIAKWLMSRPDVNLQIVPVPWGATSWYVNRDVDNGFMGAMMERTAPLQTAKGADLSIQLQLPDEWTPNFGQHNVGVTAGVETDRCNPEWVSACNRMSAVIVPSKHAANGLLSSGNVKVPLHVVPEAFSDAVGRVDATPLNIEFSCQNNLLIVAQLTGFTPETDRKNIFYSIKWMCEVLADRPDTGIVIKTNAGRNTRIDRRATTNVLSQLLREVRKESFPKVHLLHGTMSDEEMAGLYRHPKINALVSLTRGEGYGLPILEAAASGLPIIATAWSGHTEFLSKGKYIGVDYKLSPIAPTKVDNKIFVQGSKWAEPNEDDFKRRLRKFLDSSATPKQWASDLRTRLLSEYSQEAVNGYLSSALEEFFK